MPELNWRELFRAAIFELDTEQLQIRVDLADDAMDTRLADPQIPRSERKDIEAALSALCGLKRLKP
jgi:hypothetical protein